MTLKRLSHILILILLPQLNTMFAVLQVLLASAAAVQAVSLPSPPNLVREQVGARIIAELAKNEDSASVEIARQLLGGGDDYAPYEVPCPSNFEWIRPAAVSRLTSSIPRGLAYTLGIVSRRARFLEPATTIPRRHQHSAHFEWSAHPTTNTRPRIRPLRRWLSSHDVSGNIS